MKRPALLASLVSLAISFGARAEKVFVAPAVDAAAASLAAGERIDVLVLMDEEPAGRTSARPQDGDALDRMVAALPAAEATPGRRLSTAPILALSVTPAGLAALKSAPGVLAITKDGIVRPAGQVSTAFIGADRLFASGLRGDGRAAAIVDSGVDVFHPDLGGAAGTPSPRVLAGYNFAGKPGSEADLSDCSGHGTAVAGVIGGPLGVAPGSRFVALKIFDAADGCRTGSTSNVLAAVDWAVANRRKLGLEVINLSLAGDKPFAGFCDRDDPISARVFDAARTAGLAVVAASGNDGKTEGVTWPACFSSVAAVGMVYPASMGSVSWGGASSCRDASSAPDVVPCASNTGPSLALLAPGVSWSTAVPGGGRTSTFSGTSAAAPAVAAALLLSRQARALQDPLLSLDLLRSSGAPVRDDRTGRLAPRLDLAAALDATAPISGTCVTRDIPDGASSGTICEALVSSLTGRISSLALALTIDHPDPTELVVTLTGPDGTDVLLMNRSGKKGEAVREVFGRTADAIEPLSGFNGRDASGRWRLTVIDSNPGNAGRIVSWALLIEPEGPAAATGPFAATSVFPAATQRSGRLGAYFTTDARFFNTDPLKARDVSLRFYPSDRVSSPMGTDGREVSFTIPPMGTRVLGNVLGDAFRTSDYGPLFVSAPESVVAGARTATAAPQGGSYGTFVRALGPAQALSPTGEIQILIPPIRETGFRLNIGLTEIVGGEAGLEVTVKDRLGAPKGVLRETVGPYSLKQINDIYAVLAITPDKDDRIEVRTYAGGGRVLAFGSAVDNETNDSFIVNGSRPVTDMLLPAAAHAAGQFGSRFLTDLKLANPHPFPVRARISYIPTTGPAFDSVVVPVGANGTRLLDDVLELLFWPFEDVSGALRITVFDGATLVVSSRTYTQPAPPALGSYGLSIDPLTAPVEATPGRRIALTFLSGGARNRTNLGIIETSGQMTRLRLTLYGAEGEKLIARELTIEGGTGLQWNDIFATLGIPPRAEASGILEVLSGGSVVAHAIQIDNTTNDAVFVGGRILP